MDALDDVGVPNCPTCLIPLELDVRRGAWVCIECRFVRLSWSSVLSRPTSTRSHTAQRLSSPC